MSRTVALTGASGFVGSHVAARLVAEGWRVRALSHSRALDPATDGLTPIPGALDDRESLVELVRGADAVVHCAGLVRASSKAEFAAVNTAGTARLAAVAASLTPPPRFILMSSLAARAPALSAYASSKRAAEEALAGMKRALPWAALRPPAVYGPGDTATLGFFRQIRFGVAAVPACPKARFSLIYVADLAAAVAAALMAPVTNGSILEVRDDRADGYTWPDVAGIAARELGRRAVSVPVPRGFMRIVAAVNVAACAATGRAPMVTPGKVRELFHPDWVCSDNPLVRLTDWTPQVAVGDGFARTIAWYRRQGWL
ncbi:MAG: NAD-dependent epimerase/dehydratase family protein [Alphaproteobacteria bacterium]